MANFVTVTGYKGERILINTDHVLTVSDAVKPVDLDEEESAQYDTVMRGIGCIIVVAGNGERANIPLAESYDKVAALLHQAQG